MSHTDIFKIWNFHKLLDGTNLTLKGHSRGGERTCFIIPALSIMFDAGLRTHQTPNNIFITHTHCDHFFDLPIILTGENKPVNIYTPIDKQIVMDFITSSFKMMNPNNYNIPKVSIFEVKPGDNINFVENKKKYKIKVFKCYHRVKTVGYGLSESKVKLKQEYLSYSNQEIVKLKKENVNIFEMKEDYQVVYLTDTNIKVFNNTEIFKYKNIIVECTILDEENKNSAYKNGHIYWGDLKEIVKLHSENKFILIHFSTRYSNEFITNFFDKEMINNVFPWIN